MDCDVVIVGAGPAGLTAGLYAARARRCTVLLEEGRRWRPDRAHRSLVENYPGFPDGINGYRPVPRRCSSKARSTVLWRRTRRRISVERADDDHFLRQDERGRLLHEDRHRCGRRRLQEAGRAGRGAADRPRRLLLRHLRRGALSRTRRSPSSAAATRPWTRPSFSAAMPRGSTSSTVAISLRATPVLQERAFAEPKIDFIWNTRGDGDPGRRAW